MNKDEAPPYAPVGSLPRSNAPDRRADGSDLSLLEAISRGDPDAFRQLFERYAPAGMALAQKILVRSDLAEEAVRVAFLTVWRDPDRYSTNPGTAHSWLMSAVHSVAVDMARREPLRHVRAFEPASPEATGDGQIDSPDVGMTDPARENQRQSVFRLGLENLLPVQRQIIELMYFGALTQSQISERLSLPLDVVKSHTLMGMRSLQGATRVALRASSGHVDGPGSSVLPPGPKQIAVQASAPGGSAMSAERQFAVRIDTRNKVAKIALRGELDMATVPILTDHLVHQERTDIDAIMIDLRDLTFLDCSALHAFLKARDHAEQNEHLLVLIGATASARRLFELTGTQYLLDADAAASVIARFSGEGAPGTDEVSSFDVDTDA